MSTLILVMAAGFAYWQNRYFGHNLTPSSEGELICDGIVVLLVAMWAIARQIEQSKTR